MDAELSTLRRLDAGGFAAGSGGLAVWRTKTVLLATGVVDGIPALAGIDELQRQGLLRQCPICDGFEHRSQRILVLGDGLHAAREAAFIARFSPRVTLACLSRLPVESERGVAHLPALARSVEVTHTGNVRLQLADGSAQEFDVAYAALPAKPRTSLAQGLGAALDEHGSLRVNANAATTVPTLYAAGDVVEGLDQLVVAAGQGAVAATAIHNLLRD